MSRNPPAGATATRRPAPTAPARPFTVFLDRDGVLNRAPRLLVRRPSGFHWLPGAKEALARLNRPGIQVCLATNQPYVATRILPRRTLERLHGWMLGEIHDAGGRVDRVEYADRAFGRRHKPRPGMLEDGGRALGADPARSVMVGDNLKDAEAARRHGSRAILLATTHKQATLEAAVRRRGWTGVPVVAGLAAAVPLILAMAESP